MKLKNKILYSIFFLTISISIFHFFQSVRLFYQDKQNYIYHSILERTEAISNLLGNEISLRASQIELVSTFDFDVNRNEIEFFLNRDSRLSALGRYSDDALNVLYSSS